MQNILIVFIVAAMLGLGGSEVYKVVQKNKSENSIIQQNEGIKTNQANSENSSTTDLTTNQNTNTTVGQETRDFGADGFEDENEAEDDDDKKGGTSNVAPTKTVTPVKTTVTAPPTTANQPLSAYSLAQIAQHADAKSCYTAVRGIVYDLTNFITLHPGGANNILKICGKDGTSAFVNQHGGRPSPEQELAGHQIGVFAN